jgi:PAS domain S-box-containing protein
VLETKEAASAEACRRLSNELLAAEARCRELESERAQLSAIVEGSRDAIWSWNADGRIMTWNAQAQRLFGYPPSEIVGCSLLVLIPENRHEVARQIMGQLEGGAWYGQYETVRLHKDGTPVDVELTVSPLRDADGRVTGASTVCRDIRDRKEAQAAMTKRVAELTTLTQLTEQLQIARSPEGVYRAALQAIADALSCERASILLFDSSQVMRFVAWSGLSEAYRKAVDGHSPWRPDARDPQPIYIEDIRDSEESEALKETVAREGIRALAFIPLIANGRLIGKFMTYHPGPHRFTEHDKVLANTIARQLALAVSRHQSEEELRASEQRFRLMSEHAPVMIWMSDAQGHCLHLNRMLRAFWGVDEAGIADFDWSKTIHPDDAPGIYQLMSKAVENQESVTLKGRYANAVGQYRMLQTDARPRLSGTGEFLGMIGVNVDITEREEADRALRESEQRFRNAVEAAPSGMIMIDREGRIVLSNAQAEKLFGYARGEMVGQKIEMLVPERFRGGHPDHRRGYHEHPTSRFMGLGRDLFARRKDGSELPVEIGLSPFETAEGLMALAAIVDISDRKKAEAHRELLIAELNHRVKNTLSTVQSLALQTFKDPSRNDAVKTFEARLMALSSAHDVLTRENWESAGLREVVEQAISPHRSEPDRRFTIDGPEVRLAPKSALAIAMGLHELCTNAAKYGALSRATGQVSITWEVEQGNPSPQLRLQWQEHGGPVVKVPARRGFGSLLVEKLLASDLNGKVVLSYAPEGVRCSIVAPLRGPSAPVSKSSEVVGGGREA